MKLKDRRAVADILGHATDRESRLLRGCILADLPVGRILRGVLMENSSDPGRIYLWSFVQPLFVASDVVVLNLSRRIGGGARTWSVADVEANPGAVWNDVDGWYGSLASPADLVAWPVLRSAVNAYAREAMACALIVCGRMQEAGSVLRALAAGMSAEGPPWKRELVARAERLAVAAETGNGAAAQAQLASWEAETRKALKVGDLA